jgi:hypothetical protein
VITARRKRRLGALALSALLAAALGACGTPATVKPASTPLPGFKRAIQDAHNAAAQVESGYGTTTP